MWFTSRSHPPFIALREAVTAGTLGELASLISTHPHKTARDKAPAWYFEFDTYRGQEATPLVVDGVLYTTSAWSKAYALNAATGELLWSYDPKVPGAAGAKACCDVNSRGPALYEDNLIIATLDGRLIALDRETGAEIWSTVTVDQSKMYTITGAPRVVKDKVVIGNAGAE